LQWPFTLFYYLMLPYIILGSTKISMFGLGIVFSIIVFAYSSYQYCKANKLDFRSFFYSFPRFFFIIYFVAKLFGYLLEGNHPSFWSLLWYILLPNGSEFEYVGVVVGSLLTLIIFLFNKPKNTLKSIIDMFFFSTMRAVFCFGIFLICSDTVIGKPNDHGLFAIRSLVNYSKVTQYGQVYPYGLIVSGIALVSYISTKLILSRKNRSGIWYIWFAIFLILMNFGFGFQLYIKHGVSSIFGMNLDIKHYVNFITICICLYQYIRINNQNKL